MSQQSTPGLSFTATEVHTLGLRVDELALQVQQLQSKHTGEIYCDAVYVEFVQRLNKARIGTILWFKNPDGTNFNPHAITRVTNGHTAWFVGSNSIEDVEEHKAAETIGFLRQMRDALQKEFIFLQNQS